MNKMHVTNVWHGENSDLPQAQKKNLNAKERGKLMKKMKRQMKRLNAKKGIKVDDSDSSSDDEPMPPFNLGDYFTKSQKHAEIVMMGIALNVVGDIKNTNATDKACLEMCI